MKKIIAFTLLAVGVVVSAHAAVIIQYHRIADEGPASTRTSVAQFREHMDAIDKLGYQVIDLPALAAQLRHGEPLPDNTVVITFDDAYKSVYDEAAPLLHRRGWPYTVFVSPKDIAGEGETSNFMSWSQLKELHKQGALIANHSFRHSHMIRRLDDENESQWAARMRDDITQAEAKIKQVIGTAPKYFAYPYGEYDPALEQILQRLGYVAVTQHSGAVSHTSDLQALPRFPFGGHYGGDDFIEKVTTLPIPVASSVLLDETGKRLLDWILPVPTKQPSLRLRVEDKVWLGKTENQLLQCFASGQGAVNVKKVSDSSSAREWLVALNKAVPVGRSRINCTMAAEQGRFYWFSQLIIRRNNDGSWYAEP